MSNPTAVPRLALWKMVLSCGAIAAASLAFASGASAATCVSVVTPDNTNGTDNLNAAIVAANNNTCSSTTLVLQPGRYTPGDETAHTTLPPITKNLVIAGSHANQAEPPATPAVEVDGSQQADTPANLFTVNTGVNVTMEGFDIISGGGPGASQVDNNGTLTMWGMGLGGATGNGLTNEPGGVATINESTIHNMLEEGIVNKSTLALDSDSVVFGSENSIDNSGSYTINNTLFAEDTDNSCVGPNATNASSTDTSMDDDGSCGVEYSNYSGPPNPDVDNFFTAGNAVANGGPTVTYELEPGSPTIGAGANCGTTDARFFAIPSGSCDVGAVTNSATQETAAPTCVVTNTNESGTPATQQVTVQDLTSGVGPEGGSQTDNPSNTAATAYPPPTAVSVPGDTISNLQINNGMASFTPFSAPSTNPLVLTASKVTAGQTTQWSFTGLNWAGVAKNCF